MQVLNRCRMVHVESWIVKGVDWTGYKLMLPSSKSLLQLHTFGMCSPSTILQPQPRGLVVTFAKSLVRATPHAWPQAVATSVSPSHTLPGMTPDFLAHCRLFLRPSKVENVCSGLAPAETSWLLSNQFTFLGLPVPRWSLFIRWF